MKLYKKQIRAMSLPLFDGAKDKYIKEEKPLTDWVDIEDDFELEMEGLRKKFDFYVNIDIRYIEYTEI